MKKGVETFLKIVAFLLFLVVLIIIIVSIQNSRDENRIFIGKLKSNISDLEGQLSVCEHSKNLYWNELQTCKDDVEYFICRLEQEQGFQRTCG